ncbi:MAG: TRAP transporter large permease subunit [Thermodesulfobacteriota bacterium]
MVPQKRCFLTYVEEYGNRANRLIGTGAEIAIVAFMACMVAFIFLQVVFRYVFNNPLGWTEELCLIMLAWTVFLGSVVVARKNEWISIDALKVCLPERAQEHLAVLGNCASLVFCVVLIKEGMNLVYAQKDMLTPALEISWAWIYAPIPISSLLLCLQIVGTTIKTLRKNPFSFLSLLTVSLIIFMLLTIFPSSRSLFSSPLSIFVTMLTLFLIGMPVGIALGVVSLTFFLAEGEGLLSAIPQNMAWGTQSFTLMAIPFFLLAGEFMNKGGITVKLIRFASTLVGHIRGGLGHVSVVANLIMAGMSGSEVADAAATGSILIPSMTKKGYTPGFAAAIIAAASVIGPIFPPSIPFVIFGALGNVSVLKLFLGGVVPGIVMALFLMGACYLVARRKAYPKEARADGKSILLAFRESFLAFLMPLIIIGGMLLGIFTPTEASDVGVMYALVLGIAVYREINGKKFFEAILSVAVMTSSIMYIAATATVIGFITAREQIPQVLTEYLFLLGKNPWLVLTVINIILLVLGCFISSIPIMLIMIPILVPIIKSLQIDPVHFGVMFSINVMLGLNTPPFGMAMFIVCKIAGISIVEFTKNWWPFFVALLIVLIIVTGIPSVVLWIPSLLVK